MSTTAQRWVTVQHSAKVLGCSDRAVRQKIERGDLVAERDRNRRWKVCRESLLDAHAQDVGYLEMLEFARMISVADIPGDFFSRPEKNSVRLAVLEAEIADLKARDGSKVCTRCQAAEHE